MNGSDLWGRIVGESRKGGETVEARNTDTRERLLSRKKRELGNETSDEKIAHETPPKKRSEHKPKRAHRGFPILLPCGFERNGAHRLKRGGKG